MAGISNNKEVHWDLRCFGMLPPPNIFQNVKYYVVGAIGDQVLQLLNNGGAKREMYLGEMVSHVIADSTDSEEYTEAQEIFELPVVSSQWVLASAKCGKALPPYAFRMAPRLFSGLVFTASMLCPDDARALWATITYHGGQCHRVLSKAVTHLVATRPLGRKYGESMLRGGGQTLVAVTPDWVLDCVRQNKRIPAEDYHPSLLVEPPERPTAFASAVVCRPDLESPKPGSALVLAGGKGKVAECAEVPMPTQVYIPEETPIVKMTNMAAFPLPPPTKKSSPKAMLRNITNSGADGQPQPKTAPKSARQLIETIGREVSRGQVTATTKCAPASVAGAVLSASPQPDQVFYGHDASETVPSDMCLLGCIFYMADYQKLLDPEMLKVWTTVIEEHGGLVDPSYSNRVTHVLCEHQSSDVFKLALNDHKRVVTAYWLNDTLGKKKMDPPWYAYHFPSTHSEKICSNQIIAVSGFQNEERDRIKIMVQLLGAIYTGYMTRANSVLVCKRQEGAKYERAVEWGIPVVNVHWLSELLLGSLSVLKLPVDPKYRVFGKPDDFVIDLREYCYLMSGWRVPIKIPKESWKRFKPPLTPVKGGLGDASANDKDPGKRSSPADDNPASKRARLEGVRPKASTLLPAGCVPLVLLTGINKVKATLYAQRIVELGGMVTTKPHECTHVVSDAVVRTVKFLVGINYCLCVVTSQWLEESFAAKEFLDEAAFALTDEKFEDEFQCNIQQSLEKAKTKKVFDGLFFHITPSVQPALKILTELIQAGGGHLLVRRPTAKAVLNSRTAQGNPSRIVVTCYQDIHLCRDLRAHGIDVYNSEFVVTGLLQQTVDYRSFICTG